MNKLFLFNVTFDCVNIFIHFPSAWSLVCRGSPERSELPAVLAYVLCGGCPSGRGPALGDTQTHLHTLIQTIWFIRFTCVTSLDCGGGRSARRGPMRTWGEHVGWHAGVPTGPAGTRTGNLFAVSQQCHPLISCWLLSLMWKTIMFLNIFVINSVLK